MRVIVIGGVAAGMSAASKLRRADPKAEIAVYERGSFLSYGACGLPYYIGGWNEDPQKLIARTPEKFREMGIETHLRHEVLRVDAARKTVTVRDLDSGREFEDRWDRLMIAVGCRSAAPPVPGYDLPAVFSLRSMEDGLLLHEIARLPGVRHAVIVGGGAIGVEMAEALTRLGKRITLLEGAERLLRPFEPEFSELAARELERNGVTLRLNSRLQAIEEKGDHRLVRTEKEEIACDLVLMAAGIRPETAFLKETGIRMARNGAILVDREMRTSLPDVYAAGDCATCYHRVLEEDYYLALGTAANKTGRIAGANLAGGHEKFAGVLGTAAIKVFDLEMGRTGLSEAEAARTGLPYRTKMITSQDHPNYYPDPSPLAIKLIYDARTRRILGANVAGSHDAVMRTDIFAVAVHAGMTAEELGTVDLAYAPPFASVWDAVHIAANAAK
jgi:NADPH-dependent 2,4-dienoyl-CoA reductase/sulfur reductase-like enzyme